jgi:glycosyltransferase involved in cell wall biosynthesis
MVVTSVEEFGIAAVESQAAGRPVIAKRGGGALETVIDGRTGCFWSGGPEELATAVLRFEDAEVDPLACVGNALRFDSARFREGMFNQVSAGQATAFPPTGGGRQPLASTRLLRRAGREPQT